jgi:hypothetical protein
MTIFLACFIMLGPYDTVLYKSDYFWAKLFDFLSQLIISPLEQA